MPSLASLRVDAASVVTETMERFDRSADRDTLLRQVEELCHCFCAIAAGTLLVDGNPQGFFQNLCRSAENWRRFLEHGRKQGWPPPPACRNTPLLGAMAAGDWALAAAVAHVSAREHQPEEEYLDDFTYARIIQTAAQTPVGGGRVAGEGSGPGSGSRRAEAGAGDAGSCSERLAELLAALEECGGEEYASRIELFRALLARDRSGWKKAFTARLQEHEVVTEKRAHSLTTPFRRFAPHRYLWLEGLALLRLAEREGIRADDDYLYCPLLARVAMTEPYRGDWVLPLGS